MIQAPRRQFLRLAGMSASAALASATLPGCMRRSTLPSPAPPSNGFTGPDSLKIHAAQRRLLYGCAVNVVLLASEPAYAALVREQSSILVAENAMKWAAMRPTISTFDFDQADALVAFGEANRIKVRGHNLAWHRQLPGWFAAEANSANARSLLTTHIERVMGRYSGRIHSWDVVNEAIRIEDGRPDGLRVCPWLNLIGPDYIELAFRTARNADPQALLTYNDYGIEGQKPADQKKREAILEMLRRMKTRNVPIDAVGIQSHIGAEQECGDGLAKFMAELRDMGLQIFLTEMDVNDRSLPPDNAIRDQRVAEAYGRYLDLTLAEPAVRAVLTWGITDRYTWLNSEGARTDHLPERCLPFDREYTPKRAFFALRNSFDRRAVA